MFLSLWEEQQVVAVLTPFDLRVPEQAFEVPKISSPSRVSRAVLSEPQTAEQLLEVPTIVSCSSLQQQTAEQNVDIQVPRRGVSRSLQGFPLGAAFCGAAFCGAERRLS